MERRISARPANRTIIPSLNRGFATANHLILVKINVVRAINVKVMASIKRITDTFWLVPKTMGMGPIIRTPPPSNLRFPP